MMDEFDLDDAIYNACSGNVSTGAFATEKRVPTDREQAQFRDRLSRFLEDLPGDTSIQDLRELMEARS